MAEGMTRAKSGSDGAGVGFADNAFGSLRGEGASDLAATLPISTAQLGLWALLGTLSMLFAGFTSAYLVRQAGTDWRPIAMPPVLWLNTALLLSSSITLEVARASMRRGQRRAVQGWLLATTGLGLAFLAGQFFAWRQLAAQGVYLPTSPHGSFFYMLTSVHAAHVLGGFAALSYTLRQAWRPHPTAAEPQPLNLCATYWHFVDGVWLYLFLLLFAG